MLQKLREKTSGWIAMTILGLLIIPFALFGLDQYMVQGGASTAATVKAPPTWWASAPSFWPVSVLWRQEQVSVDEFRQRLEQVRQQQRAEQGEAFDASEFASLENKRAVLDSLIDQKVQAMAAEQAGLVVSDAMVREAIQAIPAFQVDGKFDLQRYQLALASQVPAQTPAQFDRLVRDGLQNTLVASAVAESNFVTASEMERLIRLMGERRDVSLVVLPPAEVDTTAVIDDAQIKAWYDTHQADYLAPESVSLEYVELDASTMPAPPPADEAALRARYEDEKARYTEQGQRLASHILVRVEEGADEAAWQAAKAEADKLAAQARAEGADSGTETWASFAALATAHSDDIGSKASGGDLGWISKDMMPGPFSEALFAMQPGTISDPVRSDFGWHVIALREVKAGAQESFEEVRESLALSQAEADRERAFNEVSSTVVDAVLQNPGALAPAAAAAGVTVQTLGPITARSTEGLAGNPAVKRAAFSEALIQDGIVSDPIEIAPNHNVWIRVTGHTPERTQPLAQVRDQVIAAIRADRAREAATKRADALLAQLGGGKTLAELATAEGLPAPQTVPEVPRGAPLVDPSVSEAVFSVEAPAAGKASAGKQVLADGTIVLFTVDRVVPGSAADIPAPQRQMLQQQLAQIAGAADARALVSSLRSAMEIEVVEDNL
ncbi:SurA N-terminal domain-containing protein [Novilysobacter erysipheiresistens]|uniref:Periplasmic chaperone PpiD n=1 Tax=Novilysobacter erysipheiresistens TaxID=1749332 RepID=A0ABU7YWN0_9GAMM